MSEAREFGGWVTYLPPRGTTPVPGRPPAAEGADEGSSAPVLRFGTGAEGAGPIDVVIRQTDALGFAQHAREAVERSSRLRRREEEPNHGFPQAPPEHHGGFTEPPPPRTTASLFGRRPSAYTDDGGDAFVELENVPQEPVSSSITMWVEFDGDIDWSVVNRLVDAASCTGELQVASRDYAQTHVVRRLGRQSAPPAEGSDEEEPGGAPEGQRPPLEVAAFREPRGFVVPLYRPAEYLDEVYVVPPPPVAPPSTPIAYSDLVDVARNSVSANTELACNLLDMLDLCDSALVEPPSVFFCPISRMAMRTPAVAADGHSYERCFFEEFCATQRRSRAEEGSRPGDFRSPSTGALLDTIVLYPNHNLKSDIYNFSLQAARKICELSAAAAKTTSAEDELLAVAAAIIF